MEKSDFSLTLLSNQSPEEVFKAITDVRTWWSGFYSEKFEGNSKNLHDEFSFRTGDGIHYSKHKLIEVIPNKKVVWLVTDSKLDFLEHKTEWTGTKVVFEISIKGDETQLIFTHKGLSPESECYGACAPAWTQYLEQKLRPMINS
ncbi:SRPBCC domain-containing protein [Algoriphagus sp. A40]|uniref:SRPBCC family protein n=1 Tax=Algoriphagus sp. A40 TaxID=1945863 RepID=UPI000985CA29|nr:SRPBCC domain-containing protein [Algoriphagus sp. A40]OOG71126.1 ATPase [Algoriphagus sp. A40]